MMKPFDTTRLAEALGQDAQLWHLQAHDELPSTSDAARDAGLAGAPSGTVIFTDSQTKGRGQRGNSWVTPAGRDLMFSVLLRPRVAAELWPRLTTLAAAAICRAISTCVPLRPTIKWPNDIHIGARKVCGLLAETYTSAEGPFLVLGIGLNVNTLNFSIDLHHIATSLLQQMPANISWIERESIAAAVLLELTIALEAWDDGYAETMSYVRERSLLLGKNVRALVNGSPVFGRALDLNIEGHLMLELANGETQVLTSAAEVRLVA